MFVTGQRAVYSPPVSTPLVIALVLVCVVAFIAAFFLIARFLQNQMLLSSRSLYENFDGFQRNMLASQKDLERSYDVKASAMRTELSQELQNNRRELQLGLQATTATLQSRVENIDKGLEARLKEMSSGVQSKLEQNVKEGFRHFEKVQEHLKAAEVQLSNLSAVGQSINDLNNLLKLPHLRGGFGEAQLERILADILPADSYELQYKIRADSTERVDAVVKYPHFVLPIDSKFPREQVMALFETNEPLALEAARKSLSEVIRKMAKEISTKYIRPQEGTAEMALLFVPSETLFFEIIRNPKICEELTRLKVFPVSPNTLAVTLQSVVIAKTYYEMSRGVEKTLSEMRKARAHFDNFEKRFEDVGSSLTKAQGAFNMAHTHLARYSSAVTRLTGAEVGPTGAPPVDITPPQAELPS